MWELDHKEGWALNNWCFWTVVMEKSLESPLDSKEIKPVNPKGNQPWIFIGRTDAETEAPILWPPDEKSQLTRKNSDAGKDWGQEEEGTTQNETIGWHHWLNGHEFEQTPGDGEGQGSLACHNPWGRKESDTTFWLQNNRDREGDERVMLHQSLSTATPISTHAWLTSSPATLHLGMCVFREFHHNTLSISSR